MPKKKPVSWGGRRPGAGPKQKAPQGSRTAAFELWPEHLAIVNHVARKEGISKSAAARELIATAKQSLGIRINKQLDYP